MFHAEHRRQPAENRLDIARNVYVCYTEGMPKTKVIPVRLDPEEWELIERAAAAKGHTPSAYLRHAAVTSARRDTHLHPALAAEQRRLAESADLPTKSTR